MQINTNIAALNAYRNLTNTDNRMNRSLERLSSGLKVNNAAEPDTQDNVSKINKIEESQGSIVDTQS